MDPGRSVPGSPPLVFREQRVGSGYAPRVVQLARQEDVLFVGCKDGSITVARAELDREGGFGLEPERVLAPRRSRAAVRALCEWDGPWLLVGRADGSLELIPWGGEQGPVVDLTGPFLREGVPAANNQVLAATWLDPSRLVVSFRRGGCWVLQPNKQGIGSLNPLKLPEETYSAVRLVVPLARRRDADKAERWLLITVTGELLSWNGELEQPAETVPGAWPAEERPGTLNDYGLQRGDPARRRRGPAQAAFLATDTGVYIVVLTKQGPAACRLSLPALGAMCTALSYAEDDRYRYLWAADASGDCHLFWDHRWQQDRVGEPGRGGRRKEARGLNFRRSGLVHADSQVLACFTWVSDELGALLLGQARRSDQVVVSQYRLLGAGPAGGSGDGGGGAAADRLERVRLLLATGTPRLDGGPPYQPRTLEELAWHRTHLEAHLEDFFRDRDAERHGPDAPEPEYLDWPAEALVAELFERLGADGEGRRTLLESLLGRMELVDTVLARTIQGWGEPGRRSSKAAEKLRRLEMERILQLWNLALLGVLHRHPRNREAGYLGLLRWLRKRQSELGEGAERWPELVETFELSAGIARKWGVYGEANAWRENLLRPLAALKRQEEQRAEAGKKTRDVDAERIPERLDRLTYEVLLFQRGISLLHQAKGSPMRGRRAWSLAVGEIADRRLVAVSWSWGGVELFEVVAGAQSGAELKPWRAVKPVLRPECTYQVEELGPDVRGLGIPRLRYHYSRAIHLGSVDGHHYLLMAPAREPAGPPEIIYLWQLTGEARGGLDLADSPVEVHLPAGESVYSLLELGEGWLLAGLRGHGGRAKVAFLRLFVDEGTVHGEVLRPPEELEKAASGSPEVGKAERNRVWSLAKAEASDGRVVVVAGCEGGQVYRLTLDSESWEIRTRERLVRLSSAVLALNYHLRAEGSRLYAGGEDGSIVAWEELPDGRFASLWATWERGAISALHLLPDVELGDSMGAVLAVTRQGRCVLFDDRARLGKEEPKPSPSRVPVPGGRHGRPVLGSSCFSSLQFELLSGGSELDASLQPYAVLLTASGEGTLSIVGLHAPYFTTQRKDRYQEIARTWWSVVEHGHQLRLGGAVYRTTPVIELILVRWLLDPDDPWKQASKERKRAEKSRRSSGEPLPYDHAHPEFKSWWLPRHLRPLLELCKVWEELEAELPRFSATEDGASGRWKDLAERAGSALDFALRRAWQLDDLDLFQEISRLALKKGNTLLYRTILEGEAGDPSRWGARKRAIQALYEELFAAIERTLQRWLGADGHKEARARIVVAKNMVHGDTFWQLLREAARERAAAGKKGDGRSSVASEILQRRVGGVRELVFKRDPLVSLETLRSANLSLLQLCRRLSDYRPADWAPDPDGEPDDGEVSWAVFEPYFHDLIAAAARSFLSRIELNDALAHELSRTFALALCACPSATIRIANRLTEAQLIVDPELEDDLSHRVERQLLVLDQIGIILPSSFVELFVRVGRPAGGTVDPLREIFKTLGLDLPPQDTDRGTWGEKALGRSEARRKTGLHNAEDLACLCRLYAVVGWFNALEEKLLAAAHQIDLRAQEIEGLGSLCEDMNKPIRLCPRADPVVPSKLYSHSYRFWKEAIRKLPRTEEGPRQRGQIRPEVVLVSRKIRRWAGETSKELDRRYKDLDLFQPEYRIFKEVLSRLRRAAEAFPDSAAVHKSVVEGVLGHHLLEELDEHVLELTEIAQALDPLMVWSRRNDPLLSELPELPATAESFAYYLLGRSRNAESIPKNLRALQSLLLEAEDKGGRKTVLDLLRELTLQGPESGDGTADRPDWVLLKVTGEERFATEKHSPSEKELRYLRLVLEELHQNDRVYGPPDPRKERDRPQVRVHFRQPEGTNQRPIEVSIRFRFRGDIAEEARKRLEEIAKKRLQQPYRPWDDRRFPSHGTGLYLANLAAAIVGWRLYFGENDIKGNAVTFHLERVASEGGESG